MCLNVTPCIVEIERYSTFKKLLNVTAQVVRFLRILKDQCQSEREMSVKDVELAYIYMIRTSQLRTSQLSFPETKNFGLWRQQFRLFQDEDNIWRCQGRLSNADISFHAKYPIFLEKKNQISRLIVLDCHERIKHGGGTATLSAPPPLPPIRVEETSPFTHTGIDFAGPLYTRENLSASSVKVWICLYTCCVTTAVHFDIVTEMTAVAFLRSFIRFTARRGTLIEFCVTMVEHLQLPARLYLQFSIIQMSKLISWKTPLNGSLMWREPPGGGGGVYLKD